VATRTLDSPPGILPLYARAAAPLIPGASLLPFVPGRSEDVPELELALPDVRPQAEKVAAYAKVCGFALRDTLPPTYPHVLAFPLHMAIMADGRFPFGAVGLIHIENQIIQHRPLGIGDELKLVVRPTPLAPHKRGQTFSLLTEAWTGPQKAWQSTSTMLHRQQQPADGPQSGQIGRFEARRPREGAIWGLGAGLGRRYAGVSGDRNPIHLHALAARALGFPGAIAHGMWTKARCLAALEGRLPDAFQVDVRFRKPIRLPATVEFLSDADGEEIEFAVRDAKRQIPHLDGRVAPLAAKSRPNKSKPKPTSGREPK